jgi:hypothetical protein
VSQEHVLRPANRTRRMARMQEFVGTPEFAVHMMRASCAGSMASCAAWLQRRARRPRGHRLSFCYITKKTKKEVSLLDHPKPLVCCSFLFVCSSFPCRCAFLFFLSGRPCAPGLDPPEPEPVMRLPSTWIDRSLFRQFGGTEALMLHRCRATAPGFSFSFF